MFVEYLFVLFYSKRLEAAVNASHAREERLHRSVAYYRWHYRNYSHELVNTLSAACGIPAARVRQIQVLRYRNCKRFKQELNALYEEFYYRLTGENLFGIQFLGGVLPAPLRYPGRHALPRGPLAPRLPPMDFSAWKTDKDKDKDGIVKIEKKKDEEKDKQE